MNDARHSKAALRIGNTIGELTRVVDFVEAFGRRHALPVHAINNLNLCLDELLGNTISYGYDGPDPRVISLTLSLDGGYLIAEIEDDARPFDPRRAPPLPAAARSRQPSDRRAGTALRQRVDGGRRLSL